jgi:two-component system chemotaxis sensor kinase CheA
VLQVPAENSALALPERSRLDRKMSANEYLHMYLEETEEFLESLGNLLLALEKVPNSITSLNEIFRIVHTIKGSAAVIELEDVSEAAHQMENLLSAWRKNSTKVTRNGIDVLLACLDALKAYHQELSASGQPPEVLNVPMEALNLLVQECSDGLSDVVSNASGQIIRLNYTFGQDVQLQDLKAKLILVKLRGAGKVISSAPTEVELSEGMAFEKFSVDIISQLPEESLVRMTQIDGVQTCYLEKNPTTKAEPFSSSMPIESVYTSESVLVGQSKVLDELERKNFKETPSGVSSTSSDTLRVPVARLDDLMNLAGELVIQKARLAGLVDSFKEFFSNNAVAKKLESIIYAVQMKNSSSDSATLLADLEDLKHDAQTIKAGFRLLEDLRVVQDHLGRTSSGLQRGILATRMIPIGPMFNRFQRMVRDLAQTTGKKFEFEIVGENVELDKRLIDELTEPLLHLLRNAIDHGLEDSETRIKKGKNSTGRLRLSASHNGNSVVIQVEDDGRGLDIEKIRKKAIYLGMIGEEEAGLLSPKQVIEFLWSPGFSTADKITDISGRGFGLDIVRSRINRISGKIELFSEMGMGTTFQIRLPLTLAIMPTLLVRVGGQAVAIPIELVLEVAQISTRELHQVQGVRTMELRGKFIPVVNASTVFNWKGNKDSFITDNRQAEDLNGKSLQESNPTCKVVIVTSSSLTAGVVVDDFLGRQEIVIKSLSDNYENIRGLAGASILGDGSVCLVMDTDGFLQAALSQEGSK